MKNICYQGLLAMPTLRRKIMFARMVLPGLTKIYEGRETSGEEIEELKTIKLFAALKSWDEKLFSWLRGFFR